MKNILYRAIGCLVILILPLLTHAEENIWRYPVKLFLNRPVIHMGTDETASLVVTTLPQEADKNVIWKSSDESVATVSTEGVVTGVTAGNAVITATSALTPLVKVFSEVQVVERTSDYVATTGITALPNAPAPNWGVAFSGLGFGVRVDVSVTPSNATDQTWTAIPGNDRVATVQFMQGLWKVFSEGGGTTTITFVSNDGGYRHTFNVNCLQKVPDLVALSMSTDKLLVTKGKTALLTVNSDPATAFKDVTWGSSDETVVKVSADGVVAGVGLGTATVSAISTYSPQIQASCEVTVTEPTEAASVTISPENTLIPLGTEMEMSYTISPSNAENPIVTWSSSDPTVVSIDESSGQLRALNEGTATITAVSYDKKASTSTSIIVKRTAPMASIMVNGTFAENATLKLRLLNWISEVETVQWYHNDLPCSDSIILGKGENKIKGVVTYKDGMQEIVVKYINI